MEKPPNPKDRKDRRNYLTCDVDGHECLYRYTNRKSEPLPTDERMKKFAKKYATKWFREYGSLPGNDHPFPNPWEYTFLICFWHERIG